MGKIWRKNEKSRETVTEEFMVMTMTTKQTLRSRFLSLTNYGNFIVQMIQVIIAFLSKAQKTPTIWKYLNSYLPLLVPLDRNGHCLWN